MICKRGAENGERGCLVQCTTYVLCTDRFLLNDGFAS